MLVRIKHIFSLLLVLLLFAPSIVKFEHEHEHFECHSKTEKHIHTEQETCNICNFEYSIYFADSIVLFASHLDVQIDANFSTYSFQYSQLREYSFSLRAPPVQA